MKIDWKHLATTPGYRSLKADYIRSLQLKHRSKAELITRFYWAISRAKHFSLHTGESVEVVINRWENARTYSWFSFYEPSCQY